VDLEHNNNSSKTLRSLQQQQHGCKGRHVTSHRGHVGRGHHKIILLLAGSLEGSA
jgi:hypothetical protein